MAGYKGHIAGGVVFILLGLHFLGNYINPPNITDMVLYISTAVMFALWPDVDIKSVGQKIFYTIFFGTDLYLIVQEEYKIAAYFGLIIILPILAKHRGWTHTIAAMILIPLPILLYPVYNEGTLTLIGLPYYASAVTGYFSHLVLDKKFTLF